MALVFLGVVWLSDRIAIRGVRMISTVCEGRDGMFLATVRVKNTENIYKLVSVNVQDHLVPAKGQQWPDRPTRVKHEQETTNVQLLLQPHEEKEGQVTFQVPSMAMARCTVRAKVGQQHRMKTLDEDA